MNFDPLNFDMGIYAVYIWPAYGVSALALGGITLWTLLAWRRAKARLAALEGSRETREP
ncbi:MAG TPA: heme exporter protein CcmD [Rhizomicrobium sp.]|nr:heme exporter protein CcmD [Rhizomicrobium sp.]